jgi:metal-responsive CopG/Arc/MetJ family transcriptional regulator
MSQTRKERQREKRRNEGYRPLEIWLPQDMIAKLDAMKTGEMSSRDAVIMALVEDTLDLKRPVRTRDQLALL